MKLHMQILIALGLGIKRNGHIFLGLIAGIILGIAMHAYNASHEPTAIYNALYALLNFIGQAFIRLIQMVIIPLIFSAIVIGISSIGDNKQLSAFGIKMVFYYSILSIAAVVIGTTLAFGLHPGDGVQSFISAESAAETQKIVSDAIAQQEGHLGQMFINLIPANPIEAFSKGDTIPIIIFVVIFAMTVPKLLPVSIIGAFIPYSMLKANTTKRNENFAKQLPDALDLISSSLRAGHSIYSAFEVVTKEMSMPISGIFKTALDEIAVGSDSKLAITSLSKTMPDSIDLKFFITAVILQREVGGNLAKILDGLAYTIRERFKMAGQLKAQTAQARFSGIMLVCVPPIIAVILFVLSPDYMKPLLDTDQGNTALLLSISLLLTGVYMIKRIMTIEI